MPPRLARRVDGDPVGVRGLHVVVGRVRIRARDHDHSELAAAGDELAEHVPLAEPGAAVVERNRGRVVGDTAARAEADRVRARAGEVVEPEGGVELDGIVLDERELGPAHRPRGPGWSRVGGRCVARARRREGRAERQVKGAERRAGERPGLEKLPPGGLHGLGLLQLGGAYLTSVSGN